MAMGRDASGLAMSTPWDDETEHLNPLVVPPAKAL